MLARCYTATVSPSLPQPVIIAYHLSERRGGKRAGSPNGMEVGTVIYSAGNKYTRFCYELVLYPPLSLSFSFSSLRAIFSSTLKGAVRGGDRDGLKEMMGLLHRM